MSTAAETMREIETFEERELKDQFFELDGDGPDPGPSYTHQVEGLRRIEAGCALTPPVSGILHYPTGAGKTRVGMELIARALEANSRHRFIWATHTKNLLRQTMVRMAELSRIFPKGTRFTWADADEVKESEEDFHVIFMTRSALTNSLDRAGDGRVNHRWQRHLRNGDPMTLIYDECHQLGADKLQRCMRKFYESGTPSKSWRVIGLSATPVPTRLDAHDLLAQYVFPLRSEMPSTSHGWPFHVFQRIRNETLIQQGVLCPINLYLDQQGEFDLPADLLRKIIGDAHLKAPGRDADETIIQKYALQFNSKVMADPRVIAFLARKIGENLRLLGKTIVFVPNIDAANRMAGLLYETFPSHRGKVAAVHSKMDELEVPGQGRASVHEILDRFRRLGAEPSVLVNVDMLTEGFDDPKVRSVVLARLTLSTNRFWQMIGRGTRGPATRPPGTPDCFVIDPVKLTRVYDYFAGYEPSLSRDTDVEFEELEDKGAGQDRISPKVPHVVRPPEPSTGVYAIDPDLERVHTQVAAALRHFLRGEALSEADAVDVALHARVILSDGQAVLRASAGTFDPTTATALLLNEISSLERRAGVDLGWFRQQLPVDLTESLLKQRMRMLRAVDSLRLWTESQFAEAQMGGAFLAAMGQEAAGTASNAATPSIPVDVTSTGDRRPLDAREEAVLDALLAVAGADGHVDDVEVQAIAETLRRMFGRTPSSAEDAAIRSRKVPLTVPFDRLETALSPAERQLLLWQMAEVAAADRIVTAEERAMLDALAARLQVPESYVAAVLGANLARTSVKAVPPTPSPTGACVGCGSSAPAEASFCPSCGARLALAQSANGSERPL